VSTLRALLRAGRPPAGHVALSVALGSLATLAGIGLLSLAGYLISRSAEHPPVLELTVAIVAVRACGIAKPVARYFERLRSHDLAFRVLARMRVTFYRKLEPLIPGRTHGFRQGELLAGVVGDVDATQNLFLRGIGPPLVALVTGSIAVALAAAVLPSAALVLAAGLIGGGVFVPALAWHSGRSAGPRRARARAELTTELVELLRGAPELVALGADRVALARIERLDAELRTLTRRDAAAAGAVEGLTVLVTGLTVAGVLAVAVSATASGTLDRVLIAALALGALASFEAISPLPATARTLRETLESGRRLLAFSGQPAPVVEPERPLPLPAGTSVGLEHVSYDHPGGQEWQLRDVEVRLEPGTRVALVGPSGAGKSTVAELLVRFMDPDGGSVALGGTDLRRLRTDDVRAAISLDGQDAYLFSSNIRENVRLARPSADDDAVEEALRRARVWGFVESLPEGLDTFVGEEGANLSGGERRRVALARTFLADAPVLVLDEPTAHLDPETAEALVHDALTATRGKSVLLITHRARDEQAVDRVIRIRRGTTTERQSSGRIGV
jgi:ATP-binding cassette, subfamily C, bacterial CydC